jgi:hypothetical protein
MHTPRESALKTSVLKYLAVAYPTAAVRKRHGTVYTKAGDPDVYLLAGGVHIELELKVPGESATPLQLFRLREWEKAGAYTAVIHSIPELCAFLSGLVEAGVLPGRDGSHVSHNHL